MTQKGSNLMQRLNEIQAQAEENKARAEAQRKGVPYVKPTPIKKVETVVIKKETSSFDGLGWLSAIADCLCAIADIFAD